MYQTYPPPELMRPVLEINYSPRRLRISGVLPLLPLYVFESLEGYRFHYDIQIEYGVQPTSCPMDVGGVYPEGNG